MLNPNHDMLFIGMRADKGILLIAWFENSSKYFVLFGIRLRAAPAVRALSPTQATARRHGHAPALR
jgi:hypothetical protein